MAGVAPDPGVNELDRLRADSGGDCNAYSMTEAYGAVFGESAFYGEYPEVQGDTVDSATSQPYDERQ